MIFNPILTGGKKLPVLTDPGTAADLLSGKQLIDQNGEAITGTIATKTASDLTASGSSIIVPAGYYDSEASKSVETATQATPSISVSSAGLITASSTQTAGYVSAGTKSATRQLTTQAGTTITPGTSQKTAVSSGRYTTGTVYVAGDADLKAANIKSGVNIFGVTGTYSGSQNWIAGYTDAGKTSRKSSINLTGVLSTHRVVYGFCDDWSSSDLYDLYPSRGYGCIVAFVLDRDTGRAHFLKYSVASDLNWGDGYAYDQTFSTVCTQYSSYLRVSSSSIGSTYFNGNYIWIAIGGDNP